MFAIPLTHGVPIVPAQLWGAWNWEPFTLTLIIAGGLAYDLGVSKLWTQAGRGHGIRRWQPWTFKGGLAMVCIALISPLDALSGVLFSAHMVQHLLLIWAAPLFVMSAVPLALLWDLPLTWRRKLSRRWHAAPRIRRLWAFLTRPLTAWVLFAAALWTWHFPTFYQAALRNDLIHLIEHACFFSASALYWWTLFKPGHRHALNYGGGVLSVFTTGLHSSALCALLLFSSHAWYPAYAQTVESWGTTALADQQLAGLIMWMPMGVLYLAIAGMLLVLWLNTVERAMQRREVSAGRTRLEAE